MWFSEQNNVHFIPCTTFLSYVCTPAEDMNIWKAYVELLCKTEYKEQVKGGKFKRILFTYFMYEVFVLISLVERNAGVEILSRLSQRRWVYGYILCVYDIEYIYLTLSCMFLAKYALAGDGETKYKRV